MAFKDADWTPRGARAVPRMRQWIRCADFPLVLALAWLLATPASGWHTAPTAPAPTLPGVLLAWRFDPLVVIGLVVAAAATCGRSGA